MSKEKPAKDTRSRKWMLEINNPKDHGWTHDRIKEELLEIESLIYWCMSDEVGGETETYHTHIYIILENAIRWSTLKKKFPGMNIQEQLKKSKNQNCKDYVFKEGKWLNDPKGDTNLRDTHEEWGELPIEEQGKRNDWHSLYAKIKEGVSDFDLLEAGYMNKMEKVERARQIIRNEKFKNTFRVLNVEYVFGTTGTGKTRGVMEQYGYENVFRVTNYPPQGHPFDNYNGQDVIIFEEFRSSLKIQDMLNLLDGYPLDLPCRYANKVACYTKVYIITNISLESQYVSVQEDYNETWLAFLRRIHKVKEYTPEGVREYPDIDSYFERHFEKTAAPSIENISFWEKGDTDA